MMNLPKDLHGLIFSFLWRIEAKGIPLTCKLFHSIIKSPRWFKGWRMFKTRFHNPEFSPTEYDHFDTFDMVLSRFQEKNPQSKVQSFYTINPTNNRIHLLFEDEFAFSFESSTLHESYYTWKELRKMQRTWTGFVEGIFQ